MSRCFSHLGMEMSLKWLRSRGKCNSMLSVEAKSFCKHKGYAYHSEECGVAGLSRWNQERWEVTKEDSTTKLCKQLQRKYWCRQRRYHTQLLPAFHNSHFWSSRVLQFSLLHLISPSIRGCIQSAEDNAQLREEPLDWWSPLGYGATHLDNNSSWPESIYLKCLSMDQQEYADTSVQSYIVRYGFATGLFKESSILIHISILKATDLRKYQETLCIN